eukprot:scaffold112872_cov39-Tisochrysis_lutea.AAC.3
MKATAMVSYLAMRFMRLPKLIPKGLARREDPEDIVEEEGDRAQPDGPEENDDHHFGIGGLVGCRGARKRRLHPVEVGAEGRVHVPTHVWRGRRANIEEKRAADNFNRRLVHAVDLVVLAVGEAERVGQRIRGSCRGCPRERRRVGARVLRAQRANKLTRERGHPDLGERAVLGECVLFLTRSGDVDKLDVPAIHGPRVETALE